MDETWSDHPKTKVQTELHYNRYFLGGFVPNEIHYD